MSLDYEQNNQVEKLWHSCLAYLKSKINQQSYETWFKPILPVKYEEGILTLNIPNRYHVEWIESHYGELLKAALNSTNYPDVKPATPLLYACFSRMHHIPGFCARGYESRLRRPSVAVWIPPQRVLGTWLERITINDPDIARVVQRNHTHVVSRWDRHGRPLYRIHVAR